MPDIAFVQSIDFPREAVEMDWLMSPLNLIEEDPGLASAGIVALASDRLANKSDVLPGLDDDDRRGWWGDLDADELYGGWPVGSRLWLLRRAKITSSLAADGGTVARAEAYTREAMRPFVERKIASKVTVVAERTAVNRIDVLIRLYRGPEPAVELRYAELWDDIKVA
ncbi:phage GP46 family protein [Bradyrhizobium japonicum]|uniref:phage GP46 family protein n=1 Tax=Bradyrhizobium japonicum TaxID=375 RepID=UPI001E31E9E5|nr:phage GP46 family protein [Bradyrhizobium japonicum]MCD9817664.1 phage GP46 family protein [Bradyrhizobium japonicum]MEB2672493.1 phage GP46 family protein [Bradyrhizobium japonicum]WRI91754.1 phage GP46 family protein [Bradyrhizobium japonicum]